MTRKLVKDLNYNLYIPFTFQYVVMLKFCPEDTSSYFLNLNLAACVALFPEACFTLSMYLILNTVL